MALTMLGFVATFVTVGYYRPRFINPVDRTYGAASWAVSRLPLAFGSASIAVSCRGLCLHAGCSKGACCILFMLAG